MQISEWIRERGPVTVAAFMDRALYDPSSGYYARAAQRSGRAGDFFTSVDVGPLFGELLGVQIAEMARLLGRPRFDLVEAGAGNGRLAADILAAVQRHDPDVYGTIHLHLAEASASARDAQRATLGVLAERLSASSADLPEAFEGVLIANELLDALPVHQVVMREDGLKEVYVDRAPSPASDGLALVEGPPSTPRLEQYLKDAGAGLKPGWRVEIGLRAVDWIHDAARRLTRGFMILVDYGHEARELYSAGHASGTLTTFTGHRSGGPESSTPSWLLEPGTRDITAHVDFTSVRAAAEAEGLTALGFLDQTYFLMGLIADGAGANTPHRPDAWTASTLAGRSRALKTLILPGGLGSTQKVLLLGRNVGTPRLRGTSFKVRVT